MDDESRQKLNAIHEAIVGSLDGKPGINTRLDRIEQRIERHKRFFQWTAIPLIGVVITWLKAKAGL